jgi:hypothetical protein
LTVDYQQLVEPSSIARKRLFSAKTTDVTCQNLSPKAFPGGKSHHGYCQHENRLAGVLSNAKTASARLFGHV